MMNSESFIHQPVLAAGSGADAGAGAAHAVHPAAAAAPGATRHDFSHHPSRQQQQQQQLPSQQPQQQQHGGGALLYSNLIPGHYRYGAKPPPPPPGPLSYQQQQQQQQQQQMQIITPYQPPPPPQQQQQQQHVHYPSSSYQIVAPSPTVVGKISTTASGVGQQTKHPNYTNNLSTAPQSGRIIQVSEPDEEFEQDFDDEDLLVVKLDDDDENDGDDDTTINENNHGDEEQYYRPFRHQITAAAADKNKRGGTTTTSNTATYRARQGDDDDGSRSNKAKEMTKSKGKDDGLKNEEEEEPTRHSPGVDLLALLLLDEHESRGGLSGDEENEARESDTHYDTNHNADIAVFIRDASAKSQRARSLTHALAGKEGQQPPTRTSSKASGTKTNNTFSSTGEEVIIDNRGEKYSDQLYAAASNAHVEAALSYRRVYQTLFGILSPQVESTTFTSGTSADHSITRRRKRRTWATRNVGGGIVGVGGTWNNEWELAKSMLMLSDMHARTAKSLHGMGLKWNMAVTSTTTTMENEVSATTAKKVDDHGGGVSRGGISSTGSVAAGVDTTRKNNNGGSRFHQASISDELVAEKTKNDSTSSLLPSNDDETKKSSSEECSDMNGNNANNPSGSPNTATAATTSLPLQHERLRMAVRRALDTANHEEDMTNSTFLGGSSSILTAVTKPSTQAINTNNPNGVAKKLNKNKVALIAAGGSRGGGMPPQNCSTSVGVKGGDNDGGVNPVDELMKLENELRCMDMALEMGSSIASLTGGGNAAASSFRPEGSFCVVPPGSSYASSSSMWASGIILGGGGAGNAQVQQQQQQQQMRQNSGGDQQGIAGVRSRANRLQNFLGGGGINNNTSMTQKPTMSPPALQMIHASASTPPSQQQQPQESQVNLHLDNAPLDQSWWGGGLGSVLASSTILSATAKTTNDTASQQSHLSMNHHQSVGSNQNTNSGDSHAVVRNISSTTNARQLMQLMDSLNRLGNENAQLMREVEGAKAARAEAKAAKDMMAKFKDEYTQRFSKLKEALKKYNSNPHMNTSDGNGGIDSDNVVANSSYVKSTTMLEIQKRDQIIKQLSNDLKKERDECKRKDSALQKYEAFYREVKARSAEKARQRQQQLQKEKQQLNQHQQNQLLHRP